ncbi:hypothetical protein BKA69DRAFT_53579 [Paraphysoderma sedebokerense]|nr:hypothetical protein BKA69DRAFT_53579 [Paraphysoderma sedebokerense]
MKDIAIKDISCGVKRIIASSNQIPYDKITESVIGTRSFSLFHSRGKPAVKSAVEEVTLEQPIPSEVTEARENIAPFTAVTNSNLDQVTGKIPLKTRTNNVPITRSKDRLLNLKQSKVVESNVRTKENKHLSTAVESNKRKLRPKTTAQEVLFEKILDYVTPATAHSHPSTPEALRRGQSGESPLADDYVVNPIEAMDSFGFIPKSEIARTPVKANSAKLGNKENQSTGLKSSAMTRTGSTKKNLELSPFKFHNESEMLLDETIPEFGVEDGSMLV